MNNRICETCNWHDDEWFGVCCNHNSPYFAEFTDKQTACPAWDPVVSCSYSADPSKVYDPGCGVSEPRLVPHCGDCYWFDEDGYENPDPEFPELRMGFCMSWRRDTQACGFCRCGTEREDRP